MRLLHYPAVLGLLAAGLLSSCASVSDNQVAQPDNARPVRLILVGDSTMASRSGYGDAFCQNFQPDVVCLNLAKGGRSSGSYRAEGSWDVVQTLLKDNARYSRTLVLIQFGHNDQPGKPGRSTDLVSEFPVNMTRYVEELKAAGAQAVLVTPLTRRTFKAGQLQNDLRPWAEAILAVAATQHVPAIDLNAISYRAVQAMGEAQADTMAMAPPPTSAEMVTSTMPVADTVKAERAGAARSAFDRTHLGSKGAMFFSGMVIAELRKAVPEINDKLKKGGGQ